MGPTRAASAKSADVPTHREVANTNGVLQQTLERHGPAGDPPLTQAPAALHAGETGIAAQAVVADAVLQVGARQLCETSTGAPAPLPCSCPEVLPTQVALAPTPSSVLYKTHSVNNMLRICNPDTRHSMHRTHSASWAAHPRTLTHTHTLERNKP